jgi:hypothetical protein
MATQVAGAIRRAKRCDAGAIASRLMRRARIGQHDHARDQAEAGVEHLGDVGAVRRVVVEQHDAIGQHHRAGRPRDDRLVAASAEDVEQLSRLCSDATWPPAITSAAVSAIISAAARAVAGDRRRSEPAASARRTRVRTASQRSTWSASSWRNCSTDTASSWARSSGSTWRTRDRPGGVLGLVEADPVEALHVAEQAPGAPVGRRELGVVGEHLPGRADLHRVCADTVEHAAELVVVGRCFRRIQALAM